MSVLNSGYAVVEAYISHVVDKELNREQFRGDLLYSYSDFGY